MGLRINNNVSAVRALRNLKINDRLQSNSLERLSTGLNIIRASDDPAGLVISEQLRGQIISMKQAVENTQNAANLIGTADASLQKVSDMLNDIRDSLIFALNEGVASPEQVGAEQAAVDEALTAIDRIANTTRYSDSELLDGSKGINVFSTPAAAINDLNINRATFAPAMSAQATVSFTVDYTTAAQRAVLSLGSTATSTKIRLTGGLGTQEVNVSSMTRAQVITAINQIAPYTGVYASTNGNAYTEKFGTTQSIKIEVTAGTFNGLATNTQLNDIGLDGEIRFNGTTYKGEGRDFRVASSLIDFSFAIDDNTLAAVNGLTFKVQKSGLSFQTNERAQMSDRMTIGIRNTNSSSLGFEAIDDILVIKSGLDATTSTYGGTLSSLKTGGTNDLNANPTNALRIIDKALEQVNGLRGFLGAIQANNLQPNLDTLEVAIENITSSESQIRDLDFAEETSNFTKTQILFQANTAVLASANLIPQTVLTLLR